MFYCYSKNLCLFLKMQGIDYLEKKRHKNGTFYYTFIKNERLQEGLNKWNEYKKQFPRE